MDIACQYLGETVTSVINKSFRQTIDRYYKVRSEDTRLAREIAEGDNAQFMYEAALRESLILKHLGFDSITALLTGADTSKISAFKEFLEIENCKALNVPYIPFKQRLEIMLNIALKNKTQDSSDDSIH